MLRPFLKYRAWLLSCLLAAGLATAQEPPQGHWVVVDHGTYAEEFFMEVTAPKPAPAPATAGDDWLIIDHGLYAEEIHVAPPRSAPPPPEQPPAPVGTWVLIDTDAQVLEVYRDQRPLARFPHIAIGSRGTATVRREGDATTPLGEFHITHINRDSRFHIFLGLDYPNRAFIDRALESGLIDQQTHNKLVNMLGMGRRPPQNTILGGHIGIHGLGRGDPDIHLGFNWTRGCVALTNAQVEELVKLIDVGTRVVIR